MQGGSPLVTFPAVTIQSQEWCRDCARLTLHQRRACNHLLHGLVTFLVSGLWLFVWAILAGQRNPWRCQTCGHADEWRRSPVDVGRILLLALAALGAIALAAFQLWLYMRLTRSP